MKGRAIEEGEDHEDVHFSGEKCIRHRLQGDAEPETEEGRQAHFAFGRKRRAFAARRRAQAPPRFGMVEKRLLMGLPVCG